LLKTAEEFRKKYADWAATPENKTETKYAEKPREIGE
jgi:hypothetical protein